MSVYISQNTPKSAFIPSLVTLGAAGCHFFQCPGISWMLSGSPLQPVWGLNLGLPLGYPEKVGERQKISTLPDFYVLKKQKPPTVECHLWASSFSVCWNILTPGVLEQAIQKTRWIRFSIKRILTEQPMDVTPVEGGGDLTSTLFPQFCTNMASLWSSLLAK